ncbi:hypothetical protein [uncultured Megasphaera sp.]|uniref:hypothetical protein n=1 Tax=uncultured Megasphaera sp. TaxID=165188 RepID=UPI002596FA61|nr:hypothetical protein [uncultured Megasphaera sp.]
MKDKKAIRQPGYQISLKGLPNDIFINNSIKNYKGKVNARKVTRKALTLYNRL